MLPSIVNWINEFTKRNSTGYTYDLSQFNSLAELKVKVIEDLSAKISELQKQWNHARQIESEARAAAAKVGAKYQQIHMDSWDSTGTSRGDEGSYSNWLKNQINVISGQLNTIDKVFGGLEQSYNSHVANFTGGNFTPGKVDTKGLDKAADDAEKLAKEKARLEEEAARERIRLEEEANNKIEALRSKLIASLKKKYDKLRKKEIEPLDAEIKRKQEELDRLNNGGMDDRGKLQALRSELSLWKQNDSTFAKDKIETLEREIREMELNLDIEELENKKDVINDKYDALLEEEKIYAEASAMIQKGKYDEMKNLLLDYGEDFKEISHLIGKSIVDIISDELDELKDAYSLLRASSNYSSSSGSSSSKPSTGGSGSTTTKPSTSGGSTSTKPSTTTPSTGSGSSTKPSTSGGYNPPALAPYTPPALAPYNPPQQKSTASTGTKVKVSDVGTSIYSSSTGGSAGTVKGAGISGSESLYVVNDGNGRVALSRTNSISGAIGWVEASKVAKLKTGGDVGTWNSVSDNGKMAILHSGERVLTADQNKAFSDLIYKTLPSIKNIPNNLLSSLKNISSSKLMNGGAYSIVFENNYNVTNETEMDVKDFQKKIQSDVEKNIKTALGKVGIRSSF